MEDNNKRKVLNTPSKTPQEIDCTSNEPNEVNETVNELQNLLPDVVATLKEAGQIETYIKFNKLLSKNLMPMNNICYLLFLDLVEWFSTKDSNTSSMRYNSPETMQFWQVGLRLFHGKFIRFMSGTRSHGQLLNNTCEKGYFDPMLSSINFAVPSQTTLHKRLADNPEFLPGINQQLINDIKNHYGNMPMVLGVDAKKISRGKGKLMGDINCWGFETMPTLEDRQKELSTQLELMDTIISKCDNLIDKGITSLNIIPSVTKDYLTETLKTTICLLGKRNERLRETEITLCRSEEKFKTLGGETWRTSRFFPVISLMRVKRNQVKKQLNESLQLSDSIAALGSTLNKRKTNFKCSNADISMSHQQNYFALNESFVSTDTRYIQQRTKDWHAVRNKSKVTGSTAHSALGLNTLKRQKEHFDCVMTGKEKMQPNEEVKQRMEYGTVHEIDAIATLTSKVLPFLFPNLSYFEEGCKVIPTSTDDYFMVVSPDGSLREEETKEPKMMYETKCKSPSAFSPHVYYKIPKYYVIQLLTEMQAYNCKHLLFTCWSEESLTAFHVQFNEELWCKCWQELISLYGNESNKRPTRFRPEVQNLRTLIKQFVETNVVFLGEFTSCKSLRLNESTQRGSVEKPYVCPNEQLGACNRQTPMQTNDLLDCLINVKQWIENAYDLTRTVASEILVYMVNDLDRTYDAEASIAHPIAYAMKGPSMNNKVFQEMTNEVIKECEKKGLSILVTSSDGQWHRYGVRRQDDTPLTVLQLQKDHWKKTISMDKKSIISDLKAKNIVITVTDDVIYEKINHGPLILYRHSRDDKLYGYLKGKKLKCRT